MKYDNDMIMYVLNDITQNEINSLAITVPIPDSNDNYIITGDAIISNLKRKYSYFHGVHFHNISGFIARWNAFKNDYANEIKRLVQTLHADYKPLENYDRTEKTSNTSNKDGAQLTAETLQTADDTSTYFGQSKTISSQDKPVVNETESRVHGNIGVTTSQQMIISEVMLRRQHSVLNEIVDMFADTEIM